MEFKVNMEKEQELRTIYIHKENCCGCAACFAVCPKQAIEMQADEEGFLYAMIHTDKCVHCALCEKVCPMK